VRIPSTAGNHGEEEGRGGSSPQRARRAAAHCHAINQAHTSQEGTIHHLTFYYRYNGDAA
jgi:hypothetical protein